MAEYANIIVDISQEKLDKTFQYRIPKRLEKSIVVGMQVQVPFGNRRITGYVVELTDKPEYDEEKIKEILQIVRSSIPIESHLIALAGWMRRNYGGTMNHALKTVIPIKEKKRAVEHKKVCLCVHPMEAKNELAECVRKHSTARAKLLEALLREGELEWELITGKLGVSSAVIRALEEKGVVRILRETEYRNPVGHLSKGEYRQKLNEEQTLVAQTVKAEYDAGIRQTYLLWGVTGSGKTEVYMELIAHVTEQGKQAIVLIPEIALTYQTVMRFYNRFGNRVSILNSRMTAGERYDQFLRAKKGEIDIMIGPRSALFTPFLNLGLIIIDEEHETSYKSENVPRYHARETAIERARMMGASVILGSATPSVASFYKAKSGAYRLLELTQRVKEKPLPTCEIVDLREELRHGNRSILSARLAELIEDRLKKRQQIMLFLNRRGLSGFVSCRACGHVLKCPHCDVSLSQHTGGRMVCHYCGYEQPEPKTCPSCGSRYISGFKAGTQKIEQVVKQRFPQARVLRMDLDTTRSREGHEHILSAFANQEADILIGTQMIVKGHDFPQVTLVGVLAADLSLHVGDYQAPERTFQLLTQAAGRAGRGELPGQVVIQTYDPTHYSIVDASRQDYDGFYKKELEYRKLMLYPPIWNLLLILCASEKEEAAMQGAEKLAEKLDSFADGAAAERIFRIGPADATVAKVNDIYKKVIYLKAEHYQTLVLIKDKAEQFIRENKDYKNVTVWFDFNPINGA
ncbi:MAG: primosomal protein N' [Clostridiales bacterium]|nr:primosomal protein N' [Clostridiales bacterium]